MHSLLLIYGELMVFSKKIIYNEYLLLQRRYIFRLVL